MRGGAEEIYPAKVYVVDVFDVHGTFDKRLKDPYPSESYSYYDSIKEAKEDIEYRKKRGYEFDRGDTFKIKSIPFEEAYPHRYAYGGRRYNKEQVKKLLKKQTEEAYWSDDGSYSGPRVTDEIEGRDIDNIFWKAFYGEKNKTVTDREAYNGAYEAVREYTEGIKDRKKKKSVSKSKRATNAAVKAFLPTGNKIKSIKNKAEEKIKSVYSPVKLNLRKKKTATKPKRKVIKKVRGKK
jgi:hypothetical protein